MQGAAPIDPPNEMAGLIDDTDWGWTWKLVPSGLVVIKFQAQPNQLVLETFNPADGTSQGQTNHCAEEGLWRFLFHPDGDRLADSVVHLSLESNFYALDVTTGKLTVDY